MATWLKSFGYAFKGIAATLGSERNFKIHTAAAVLAIGLGLGLRINHTDWLCIIACITAVLAAELFNTAIEELTNLVQPTQHPVAGRVKDAAAGAVLITALGALCCGLFIFIPRIITLL